MRKLYYSVTALMLLVGGAAIAYAAFEDSGDLNGAVFTVGSIDMKLLTNVSGDVDESNLTDSKDGPVFTNIYPGYVSDYPLKLYNNGNLVTHVTSRAAYETANDPGSLREYIFVDMFRWEDSNHNGLVEEGEIPETSIARKSIIKWKTEGIDLGEIAAGELVGLVLRFSVGDMPSTKQDYEAVYDFEFKATTEGVVQK